MKISTAKTPAKAPVKTTTAKAPRATATKTTPVKTKKAATAVNAPSLKGTKTEANLKAAFAGESEARNKYTYFAGKAKKEGFNQIADFFIETAENEKEHAKIWFKLLYGEMSDTATNLKNAAAGENFEWTNMYAKMAQEARDEGFDKIADLFDAVGKIEKDHEERY
ncbi:MAG: rubrerythrin family protein, partial [Sporomusaceae bacterium]|nr:rubrerythrin family protein [Sporomusaceae bacterium]